MIEKRKRIGLLRLLLPLLPIWLGASGSLPASAVEPMPRQDLEARYAQQSLRVSLWLDKDSDQVYRRGEPLQVTFQTNEDAYVVLYHIDVDGRVDILWPTSRFSDGFVFGGHQYRLPAVDGKRLRVGTQEGVGYVQAVVSLYPFDLRDLALDFFHESGGSAYEHYVAGDPYLAMNEVNFAVTGLEDSSDFVITNHVSYYVHREVEHPRYLCSQCHDDEKAYEPYRDTCTITIRYDYSWLNQWWGRYRFYPVYYYPTYYYVDPWTGFRWVNYWYDPWYDWPAFTFYSWPYYCYDWRYSPYWTWNSSIAYQRGNRRYVPVAKPPVTRDRAVVATRTKNLLVTDARPGEDRLRAMKERTVLGRGEVAATDSRLRRDDPAGANDGNVRRATRAQERFAPDSGANATPGLRLPGSVSTGAGDARQRARNLQPPDGGTRPEEGQVPGVRRQEIRGREGERPAAPQTQVRPPVQPQRDGGRIWTNRRSSGQAEQRAPAPAVRPPVRDDRQRQEQTPGKRPQTERSRDDGPSAGSRDESSQRQTQQPAPPPASPPGGGVRSRDSGQSSHQESSSRSQSQESAASRSAGRTDRSSQGGRR